jgi:hypothetical protein
MIEGGDDVGVDVQYPWEDLPHRHHKHTMNTSPFFVDKYPVTNAQFKTFLKGAATPRADETQWGRIPSQLFLKQPVEGAAGVVGIAGAGRATLGRGMRGRRRRSVRRCARGAVPRHGDSRRERTAVVVLILRGDANQNRLEALETGGRLKVGALLATVQRYIAFRAVAREIDSFGQGRGAVVTARRSHVLDEARQPGAGHVNGGARPLRLGTVIAAKAFGIAVCIHVTVLSVLAIAVHGEIAP